MNIAGLDRKILKAFYTQYVSVLLILLVFFVTAFQQTAIPKKAGEASMPLVQSSREIAQLAIPHLFTVEDSVREESAELHTMVEILRNHDVRAELTLFVDSLALSDAIQPLSHAMQQVDSLTKYLLVRGVPSNAFRVQIHEGVKNAPHEVIATLTVDEVRDG